MPVRNGFLFEPLTNLIHLAGSDGSGDQFDRHSAAVAEVPAFGGAEGGELVESQFVARVPRFGALPDDLVDLLHAVGALARSIFASTISS